MDGPEQEQLIEDIFEQNGLDVVVNKRYDTEKSMFYFRIYTYVPKYVYGKEEKVVVEIDTFDSVYECDRTEEILEEKAERAVNVIRDKLLYHQQNA